jgi:hypothetical protein
MHNQTPRPIDRPPQLHALHQMSSQTLNNTRFTAEAAEWDSNTKHVESTRNAFEAIKRYVPAFSNDTQKGNMPITDLYILNIDINQSPLRSARPRDRLWDRLALLHTGATRLLARGRRHRRRHDICVPDETGRSRRGAEFAGD